MGLPISPAIKKNSWQQGSRKSIESHKDRKQYKHPTTADPDYTDDELEFMFAMHEYKHVSGHKFPTWSEAHQVLLKLGYRKGV